MNLKTFLKTLKDYGYSDQQRAKVLNDLFQVYTDYTWSKKVTPTRDTTIFIAFRLLSEKNGNLRFSSQGLQIAEEVIRERVHAVAKEAEKPEIFFVLRFMHSQVYEPEIQFLLNSSKMGDIYVDTMKFLEKSGLAYYDKTFVAPKNLYTFFTFLYDEEPFETSLRLIRAYIRLSPLNPRIMKVTFSDMRGCKEEVLNAIKDMRTQGIIKEFVRDKGYSFRVLDGQEYKTYTKTLLHQALHKLRFVPPSPDYVQPVQCGWDSVGLLDEYPVDVAASMNILLFGDPGPLKQLWAQHYAYGELLSGKGTIYLSITSPPEDIRKNFTRFNKDIAQFEAQNSFIFIDCYPRRQDSRVQFSVPVHTSSLTDFGMVLSEASQVMTLEQAVVVVDSLSTLMLYSDPEQVIKFAVNQASKLKEWGWTGIFIVEKGVNNEKIENSLKFLLDGVFEILPNEFRIQWIRGMVDKSVTYALDISQRGLLLLPQR
jgi:KaiC/GvpD/RAD55 family RecA-like ATPase